MRKGVLIVVVLVVALPFLVKLLPKKLTIERIQTGLNRDFLVANCKEEPNRWNEADQQWSMTINGQTTNVFFYTDPGVIAKQYEYNKKDVGTAIVESWGLRESLGAAPNPNMPTFIGRNGMFLLIIATTDADLGRRVAEAFQKL